jgi:hypothetical protein
MAKSRDELIRADFEAYRDLTWWETLEPRFREQGIDASAMAGFREAWNRHAENRDWAWWQNEAKHYSDAELDGMRKDCIELLDAIGVLQSRRDKAAREQEAFRQVLSGTRKKEEKPQEQSKDKGREM